MIKRIYILISILIVASFGLNAQQAGYYNGTEGKTGTELKSALHGIIKAHVDFSYSDAKFILNYADSDPANLNNVILFYTKRSQVNTSWGTGANDINREHVWAKSHGTFADIRPMDGDAFNLHPADASVNITRSNYDFDECSATGTLIAEANAYYTSTQFEPQDATKGEVARTLFYMAVRYEGTDGELNLEVNDQVSNYPNPFFGKLSTLLKWNNDFPPTELERRRNERVFEAQRNRNPFIDHPEFADMIWGTAVAPVVSIGSMMMDPAIPTNTESSAVSSIITSSGGAISSAMLYYGSSFNSEEFSVAMTQASDTWSGNIDFSHFAENSYVYFKVTATNGLNSSLNYGNYRLPAAKTITGNAAVQGTGNASPLVSTIVTVAGVVTANLDNTLYLQTSGNPRSGMCIFDIRRGKLGDSIVVTGNVSEYNNLTEIDNVSYVYNYGHKRNVEPIEITIDQANEDYEGMLVKIKNVTFLDGDKVIPLTTSTNLTFTDGSSSMIVYARYNSRISGHILPSGNVDVTGVISQYSTVPGTGFQLLVNDISDIVGGFDDQAPILTGVVVNDKDWIEVSFNEKVDKATAENISNYTFTNGLITSGAYLYGGTKVLLLVTGLKQVDYTLTVNGITDLKGNSMANATIDFHSDFSDPLFKPIICNNDTLTFLNETLVNLNVIYNDSVPADFNLSVIKEPGFGTATVMEDKTIKYETSSQVLVQDSFIYEICYINDAVNCYQATAYITLNFNTSVKGLINDQVRFYPNPVLENLHVKSVNPVAMVEILDLSGKKLDSQSPMKNEFELKIPGMKGVYFLRLKMVSGESIMKKIIKY